MSKPDPGETITNPVRISGQASVFEGVVSIRVLNASNAVIKETVASACSDPDGCDYSTDVRYKVAKQQRGRIEVFWESQKDGDAEGVIRVPVWLTPSRS